MVSRQHGMPDGWEPIGKKKRGRIVRWRKGDLFVERSNTYWYWYSGIRTKHMHDNGAFDSRIAAAVAAELAAPSMADRTMLRFGEIGRYEGVSFTESHTWPPSRQSL